LDDFAFVGFGARVLDTAVIESDGFLAAGAILTPEKIIRTREMWAGNPAKFVGVLSDEAVEANRKIAPRYADLAAEYLALTTTNTRGQSTFPPAQHRGAMSNIGVVHSWVTRHGRRRRLMAEAV